MMFIYLLWKHIFMIYIILIFCQVIHDSIRKETCYIKAVIVSTFRDYAERISVTFNLEIQFEHFGKGKLFNQRMQYGDC